MIQAPSPYLIAVVLVLFSVLDVYSTIKAVRHGAQEIMPLGKAVFAAFGTAGGAALIKAIGVPFILFLAFRWPDPVVLWSIFAVCFVLLGIVGSNLFNAAD